MKFIYIIFAITFNLYAQNNDCLESSFFSIDDSFSDLNFLKQVLEGVEIVALGEEDHGDGGTFIAKTKLVKFLHEEMGFEVLAFESGFYDCNKVWQLIKDGGSADTLVPKATYGVWSRSVQMQELFKYIEFTARSSNPLIFTGFDFQFSGSDIASVSVDSLLLDLISLIDRNQLIDVFIKEEIIRFKIDFQNLIEYKTEGNDFLFKSLLSLSNELERLPNTDEVMFWKQFLKSTQNYISDKDSRDKYMFENFLWLKNNLFKDKKVIIWSANFHVANSLSSIRVREFEKNESMGFYLKNEFKDKYYSIGAISYLGERAWAFEQEPRKLPKPTKKSFQKILFEICESSVGFLNINSVENTCWIKNKKIKTEFFSRSKYFKLNTSNFFNGIFFHKEMHRSDLIDN